MMKLVRSKKEKTPARNYPSLADAEFKRLAEFLAACADGPAMSLEEVDGFFCALIAGPEIVPPSEFLPEVFGDDLSEVASSSSIDELNDVLALLLKHWNNITEEFGNDKFHAPFLFEKKEGRGNEWARGYLAGTELRRNAWADLPEDPPDYLYPMKWFAHENDPALRPAPYAGKTRDDLLAMLEAAPLAIYRHYASQRRENAEKAANESIRFNPVGAEEIERPVVADELNEDEIERIHQFLIAHENDESMNIEGLDGFFCALAAIPREVPAAEYLPLVFGRDMAEVRGLTSPRESEDIPQLLHSHLNYVIAALASETFAPILFADKDGNVLGNDWALGFLKGFTLGGNGSSKEMKAVEEEEFAPLLLPMFMLFHEHDPDPKMRTPPIRDREELIRMMAVAANNIYQYFRPELYPREENFMPDTIPTGPKVGRNEPCPCGSGKKYKRCCGG
jgi:uncharacterized protein